MRIQIITLITLFFMSCAPFVSIPRENYSELAEESEIVIITTSGEKIATSHFWMSGDTLFISEPGQLFYKGRQDTLLFDEIEEILDFKNAKLHPAQKVTAVVAGVVLTLLVVFSAFMLYAINWGGD